MIKYIMNLNIITKILVETLPEDIIRVISTYFIQKIPKNDIRYKRLDNILYKRNFTTRTVYYSERNFHYKIYRFQGIKTGFFILRNFPTLFLEYIFSIDDRSSGIRFWIEDNKCEVCEDGYWIEK